VAIGLVLVLAISVPTGLVGVAWSLPWATGLALAVLALSVGMAAAPLGERAARPGGVFWGVGLGFAVGVVGLATACGGAVSWLANGGDDAFSYVVKPLVAVLSVGALPCWGLGALFVYGVRRDSTPVPRPGRDAVVAELEAAAAGSLGGVLGVTREPLVSSDLRRDPRSAIVDLELVESLAGDLVRVVAWYDNEWGYATRLAELIESLGGGGAAD